VVGKPGKLVDVVGGRHADDVGHRQAGRDGGAEFIGECAVVAGSGHEEHARIGRGLDRILQRLGEEHAAAVVGKAAPAVVGDLGAHVGRVEDGVDRIRGEAVAIGGDELERHDPGAPSHAHHAAAVVAHRTDGAGHVRAVAVVVHRVAVAVGEVVAVHIIDVAVAVVVNTIAGDLARVRPDVRGEVGVRVVDTRVDHRDDHVGGLGDGVPGLGGIDVGIVAPAGLPGVVQAPEAGVEVVGRGLHAQQRIGRHRFDLAVAQQAFVRARQVGTRRERHHAPRLHALGDRLRQSQRLVEAIEPRRAEAGRDRLHLRGGDTGLELHQQLAHPSTHRLAARGVLGQRRRFRQRCTQPRRAVRRFGGGAARVRRDRRDERQRCGGSDGGPQEMVLHEELP
jgi:hypothetical protein